MNIWIDNTSVHAIGKCLDQKAHGGQLKDVLQFAILIMFSDNISICGHKIDKVKNISKQITEKINAALNSRIIEVEEYGRRKKKIINKV